MTPTGSAVVVGDPGPTPATPVLSVRGLTMVFPGGQRALEDASLEVLPGEIHGLVGQNGSGKSTLIRILAGYHAPQPGAQLRIRGEEVSLPLQPGQFRQLGMGFVHQTLGLVESLSVLDNVRAARFTRGTLRRIDWKQERAELRRALEPFGLQIDPDAIVGELPQSTHAVIALARAIDELREAESGLLVLDEPTPYLPQTSIEVLFAAVREIAARGSAIIFVSHRLDEVLELSDRVTVLRDGKVALSASTSDLSEERLIEVIIGRQLGSYFPSLPRTSSRRQLASVKDLSGGAVGSLSMELFEGEIVGVTSLVGDGFEDVPYLLAGAQQAQAGVLTVGGRSLDLRHSTLRDTLGAGVALVPGNRMREGGVMSLSLIENITLPRVSSYFRHLKLDSARERADVQALLEEFDVRPPDPDRKLGTLSGGNQQKAVLAKWVATKPRLLVMHEPTQGIDVGSRQQIFQQLRGAAGEGRAVVVSSLEHGDLAGLCDRVLILRRGRLVAELRGDDLTEDQITAQCLSSR